MNPLFGKYFFPFRKAFAHDCREYKLLKKKTHIDSAQNMNIS